MSAPSSKPTVRLTARAEQDSHDILLYTRRTWGERQRSTYRAAIQRALRRLEDHPQLGRPRDDLFVGRRILSVDQHVH
jgi:toxin ParE1/3/4